MIRQSNLLYHALGILLQRRKENGSIHIGIAPVILSGFVRCSFQKTIPALNRRTTELTFVFAHNARDACATGFSEDCCR